MFILLCWVVDWLMERCRRELRLRKKLEVKLLTAGNASGECNDLSVRLVHTKKISIGVQFLLSNVFMFFF